MRNLLTRLVAKAQRAARRLEAFDRQRRALLVVAALCSSETALAQKRPGARPTMPRGREIALARSAAPSVVSENARVWIWTGVRYVIADSGKSSVNCYVGRPWDEGVEPHCFDEEGSRTIMPIMMRRVELYAAGKPELEVERDIADGLTSGRFRLPSRAAITYMMSGAQKLVNGEGTAVGAWQPHMMIYMPYLTA